MKVLTFWKKQLLQSMLTGVPQIIQVKGCFRKFMKSLVLIVCAMGCTYQIWSFMEVFWTYPTNVNNIVSHPNVIGIPAFTICEFNGIRPKLFCNSYANLCTPKKSYQDFCREHFNFCLEPSMNELSNTTKVSAVSPEELPTSDKNIRQKYKNMGVKEYNFINEAKYGSEEMGVTEMSVINSEGLPTNCFAYNVVWGNASAVERKASIRNSMVILTQMSGEVFYATTPRAIQMVVHSPFMKLNPFTEGFSLKPCTTYKIYLEKIQNYLLPAPYHTNCTDYLSMWKRRGGYGPLTKKMCVDECIFIKSIELYGCFNPLQINHPNDSAKFCFDKEVDAISIENCDKVCQLACYFVRKLTDMLFDLSIKINHLLKINSKKSKIPKRLNDERIQVEIEELESSLTSNQQDKKKCRTVIIISFIRTQIQKFIYNKKYEGIEAFGYIGGFLGMWLGLSLIAVCDFLETCIVILVFLMRKLKNRNKKSYIENMMPKHVKKTYIENMMPKQVMFV